MSARAHVGELATLRTEYWLALKLGKPDLFTGVTTAEMRRERVRVEITSRNLAEVKLGSRGGVVETWGAAYERMYGRRLETREGSL